MEKQGHYIFIYKDDAEEFSSIVNGTVTYSIVNCLYHVWFEYEDADNIYFIQKLMFANSVLRKKLNNTQEDVTRLKKQNLIVNAINYEDIRMNIKHTKIIGAYQNRRTT